MRLCLYNPQAVQSVFGKLLISKLLGESKKQTMVNSKLGYFLELLKDKKVDIAIVVDGRATSILASTRQSRILNRVWIIRFISYFEVYLWCYFNKINPFKQKIIFKLNQLDPKNDVLLACGALTNIFYDDKERFKKSYFYKFKGKKIVHLSHYFLGTRRIADNLNLAKPDLYVAESDLSKNAYFRNFFNYRKSVYILPFILRDRYVSKVEFRRRKSKCLALGNLVVFDNSEVFSDFCEFFGDKTLHPMRWEIYKNRNKIKKYVEVCINYDKLTLKLSMFRKVLNLIRGKYNKVKYFQFDIVAKYNSYQMFVSPEERVGVPSVNFVEGMACGCAYLGIKSHIYDDLGLIDGENYISYDGTLEDLIKKVNFYKKRPEELERIAKNGYEYVINEFSKKRVINNFLNRIKELF